MDTKLTLKLNENIIKRAKKYTAEKKISLSRLIENYLDSLTKSEEDFPISEFVQSISSGRSLPMDDEMLKNDYKDFLSDKHK